jgi:tRNA(fMet)-specific endonuclease VapC
MICLDTNAVVAAINGRWPRVRRRLEQALADGVAVGVSTVTLFELHYGTRKGPRAQAAAAAVAAFLTLDVTAWPVEAEDAQEAADVRDALTRAGTPIGPYDLLIAAQARRRGALLVTANARELARVPGLRSEDWAVA